MTVRNQESNRNVAQRFRGLQKYFCLPVHCGEGASFTDRLYVEIEKRTGAKSVSMIAVGYALKETLQFFPGLKTVNRPVAAHSDSGHVIKCLPPL